MRLLLILYCYPPFLVPGSIRCAKLIRGLREHGVEVETVIIDPLSFASRPGVLMDEQLRMATAPGVTEHAVWSPEAHFLSRGLKKFTTVYELLRCFFEPSKREWTFPAMHHLKRVDLERFDAVVSFSQPHCNHLLGMWVQKRAGIPWIAFFSDPWSTNPYARFRSPVIAAYNRKLENRVMEAADSVLFTCPETLRYVGTAFSPEVQGKFGTLPHCFVPEWYGKAPVSESARRPPWRLLHAGHFYGPRSPRSFLRALERLSREIDLRGRLDVEFCGSMEERDLRFVKDQGLDRIVRLSGIRPYLETLESMKRADCLLLVDAAIEGMDESIFLPSKLIEYLGSGTPVLAISPRPGATARVIEEVGGRFCDISDEESIYTALREIAVDGKLPEAPDPERLGAYECGQVAGRLKNTIQDVIAARGLAKARN